MPPKRRKPGLSKKAAQGRAQKATAEYVEAMRIDRVVESRGNLGKLDRERAKKKRAMQRTRAAIGRATIRESRRDRS